ncbi:MAG TPA: hypothetical protein VK636_18125 [Gemmatimonadaceae bacterium]|nr:hypothetical protein [Gemmatimonadaceae bacterium]
MFVGVTRAKRAVVVSFPKRATAGSGGRGGKTVVPLLKRWRETFGVPTIEWTTEFVPDTRVAAGNLWSVPLLKEAKAKTLAESECPLLSYVESYAGVRFPAGSRELYPGFFSGVRRSLRGVVEWAHEKGTMVGDDECAGDVGDGVAGEQSRGPSSWRVVLADGGANGRWIRARVWPDGRVGRG